MFIGENLQTIEGTDDGGAGTALFVSMKACKSWANSLDSRAEHSLSAASLLLILKSVQKHRWNFFKRFYL